MGDRIEALETQMESVTTTLQGLALQMQHHAKQMQQQSLILTELSKQIGEDPVTWITHVEIYFDVQNTPDEMRVKLSRLSMEGSTIHWFNLLLETEDDLSCLEDKAVVKDRGVVRDLDEEVGLDFGHKPKVWRVYTRIRDKGIKE
ncbi:unnamed protein product [Vicia faba]|uniref:Retrotransposon gag protein n=1 Tax=Vicia faba TaxID=3906 RepID=A0AAV0ZXX8_VICFA|nr:unnamed protein product [Vicia faba]